MDNGWRDHDYRKGCGANMGHGEGSCSAGWLCRECENTKPHDVKVQEDILRELRSKK